MKPILPFLIAVASLSGCLTGHQFTAVGSDAAILAGYAYDGKGVHNATGTLNVLLDPKANTGTIQATLRDEFHRYDVRWTNFSGRAPYQSGGVATNLELWGDSGNGSSVFPRVFAYAAAFGHATHAIDTKLERDPTNLADGYTAIFFLTQGQYRDKLNHGIMDREKTRPYDPSKPTDANINQIGAQAAILLFASNGVLYRYYEFNQIQVTGRA